MYSEPLYRPPSEAHSAILQATVGCSHNRCAFCDMYKIKKFTILNEETLTKHALEVAKCFPKAQKVFVADGNALVMPFDNWIKLLKNIKKLFPFCQRVSTYATPTDILRKSEDELFTLRKNGLTLLYMGIESGSDAILDYIDKGVSSKELVLAGKKAIAAGINLSVTVIAGLGGEDYSDHAIATAKVISEIQPHFVGVLSLMPEPNTKIYDDVQKGNFKLPSTIHVLKEIQLLLANVNLQNTIFRSNHASNYLSLAGTLNRDRKALMKIIDHAIANPEILRPEYNRGL